MKLTYLFVLVVFGAILNLNAQNTSLGLDFTDGAAQFVPILANADNPSFTLNVSDGVLNIDVNKTVQDWSFLGLFGKKVNLSANKTLQFKVRSSGAVNFVVRLKSPSLSNAAETAQLEVTTTLVQSDEFQYYYFELSEKMAAVAGFDPTNITEMQIDITKGWTSSFTGKVEIDFFKVGFPEALQAGGNSFVANFDDGLPVGAVSNSKYTLSASDGAMKVSTDRSSGRWAYFDVAFGSLIDLSSNPVVSFDIKTDKSMVLQVFLIDGNGNGYQIEKTTAAQPTDELVNSKSGYQQIRVFNGNAFVKTSLDFSNLKAGLVDMSLISSIRFVANGTALSFNGNFFIDNLMAGKGAEKYAYIGQQPDLTFPGGAGTSKSVIVPEIHNVASVEISGGEELITNAKLSTIDYKTTTDFYHTTIYGNAYFTFDILPGAIGSDEITFTATGKDGFQNNTMKFNLTIAGNEPPQFDVIDSMIAAVGIAYTVNLSDISNGNPESAQSVTVAATSNNADIIDTVTVNYENGYTSGTLEFTPKATGTALINLILTDSEGAVTDKSFAVTVFQTLNGVPTIDDIEKANIYFNSENNFITMTGISDGDEMMQELTITAVSSDTSVVKNPVVSYMQGENTAALILSSGGINIGTATITVTVADNGGNDSNNGNLSVSKTFEVEVTNEPITGSSVDLGASGALSMFGPEGNNVIYFLNVVDTLGSKALRIKMKDKWTYGGILMKLPQELNLAEYPIVSYEVYPVDKPWWSWNYFYDANGARNIENSGAHQFKALPNQWTTLTFDYREAGGMNDNEGNLIDATRIVSLLLNMHDAAPSWPFTDATGLLYIRNIKFGSQAEFEPVVPTCTIDQIPDQVVFETAGKQSINVSGISNGDGSSGNVKVLVLVSKEEIISTPSLGKINTDGTSKLDFDVVGSGKTTVSITVEASGSITYKTSFGVNVLPANATTTSINYDLEDEKQTIRGLGTFYTDARFADLYTNDLGATVVRIGIIGNQWEPVNDNDDPDVINMQGFNYDAFDWAYFRKLKAQGVKTFILTSWSPPAWMKRNLSLDHREQAIEWEKNDNILEPYYYNEFAESMAAVGKAFKDRCGITLTAIGLQNEPFFNEPYPSAIISGVELGKLIAIAGNRFKKEGLEEIGFMSPEQVFGNNWGEYSMNGYLSSIRANSGADANVKYFAVHGYDGSGITSDFPDYSNWTSLWDKVSAEPNSKEMWMTETHIGYTDWNSAMSVAGAIHGSLWAGNISLWTNWAFETMQLTKNKPNSSFYVSKNYFKFIKPGAVRIQTESDHKDLMPTAFRNEDGQFVMVIINKGTEPLPVYIKGENVPQSFKVYRTSVVENCVDAGTYVTAQAPLIIPASSVVSIVANGMNVLNMSQIEDVVLPQAKEHSVQISNIKNESGDLSALNLTYKINDETLLTNVELSSIASNGTATFSFVTAADAFGTTAVQLVLSDDSGNSTSTVFTVTVEKTLGVDSKGLSESVKLYPVKAGTKLQVELPENVFDSYRVFDTSGRKIMKSRIESSSFEINTQTLNKGVYLISFEGQEISATSKFIVQ